MEWGTWCYDRYLRRSWFFFGDQGVVCGMDLKRVYFGNDNVMCTSIALTGWDVITWCEVTGKCWNFFKQVSSVSHNNFFFERAWKLPSYLFVRFKDEVYMYPQKSTHAICCALFCFVLLMSLFLSPLTSGIYVCNLRCANCKCNLRIDILSIQANITLSLMSEISLTVWQYWHRQWPGALWHQTITWANVDLDPWH